MSEETKKTTIKKLNTKQNKLAFLYAMFLLIGLFLIVFVSLAQAEFDVSAIGTWQFWANYGVSVAIAIFALIGGFGEGDNYYKNKEDGLYKITYHKFNTLRESIDPVVDKFRSWHNDYYARDFQQKKVNYLLSFGIEQAEKILTLDRNDVEKLKQSCIINGVPFKSLTKKQIEKVMRVFDGKVKLQKNNDNYFLNAYNRSSGLSMYERATKEKALKSTNYALLVLRKLITMLAFSFVFSSLVTPELNKGDIWQIVIDVFVRLFTFAGGISFGFMMSNTMNKIDISFIDYKKQVLQEFKLAVVDNKTFTAKTIEEEVLEELSKNTTDSEITLETAKNEPSVDITNIKEIANE